MEWAIEGPSSRCRRRGMWSTVQVVVEALLFSGDWLDWELVHGAVENAFARIESSLTASSATSLSPPNNEDEDGAEEDKRRVVVVVGTTM